MKDFYYILGVKHTATSENIKEAHRKLSKKFHPDLNEGDSFFEQRFKDIQEAYETLSNPQQKHIYDTKYAFLTAEPKVKTNAQEPFLSELERKIFEYRNHCEKFRQDKAYFEQTPPSYASSHSINWENYLLHHKFALASFLGVFLLALFFSFTHNTSSPTRAVLKMLSDAILLGGTIGIIISIAWLAFRKKF